MGSALGYSNERREQHTKDSCVIIALTTIAKIWNQLKCLETAEWTKRIWYRHTHTMEYYLASKNNEILSFAKRGMELVNKTATQQNSVTCSFSGVEAERC